MTSSMKKIVSALTIAVMTICLIIPAESSFAATKKYKSKGNALAPYTTKDYKPVSNKKLKPLKIKSFYTYGTDDMPHILGTKKGNKKFNLQTLLYLPVNLYDKRGSLNLRNPQSLSITPDGSTAYVTHVLSGEKGFIVKYNLKKLVDLGLNVPGSMSRLVYPAYPEDDLSEQIMSCITIGPTFKIGHGAAFSYNPKDKRLWFSTKTKKNKTDLWRVNMKTLKPDLCINYTFDKKIAFGNNLTFDKNGKIYQFQYSSSKQGKCPKDAVKIYQGTINLKAKKKVSFKLMMNIIKYPVAADHNLQSAGYDYKNNRIYLAANSAILSVPVAKLTKKKVKPSDVWEAQFDVNREFEDFEVDKNGKYYLLVNKSPEIMTNLVKWKNVDYSRYENGEYIYPDEE